jgi:hypothetical protein
MQSSCAARRALVLQVLVLEDTTVTVQLDRHGLHNTIAGTVVHSELNLTSRNVRILLTLLPKT